MLARHKEQVISNQDGKSHPPGRRIDLEPDQLIRADRSGGETIARSGRKDLQNRALDRGGL
ncbi:MAG TPA: hypothetical protein VJ327_09965, partial [Patescibacteria group bacterium]|nr:hypothetical protein [Patescibacteria group bacterium]